MIEIPNCEVYASAITCKTCDNGNPAGDLICPALVDDCVRYDESGKCILCSPDKMPVNGGLICATWISNCEEYHAAGLCRRCSSEYVPSVNEFECV